jgi:hypothetical protein
MSHKTSTLLTIFSCLRQSPWRGYVEKPENGPDWGAGWW